MLHQIDIKVRGYHLDFYGHVNNARYLEFLEEARWAYFEETHGLEPFIEKGLAFVVVNININYRRPAVMNELLTVHTHIKHIGNRSGVIRQVITLKDSDVVVADADVTFAVYDEKQGAAVVISGGVRAHLESLLLSLPNTEET